MTKSRTFRHALAALLLSVSIGSAHGILIGNTFDGDIYTVDPTSGATTFVGSTGVRNLAGITYQPGTGVLFGLTTFMGNPANTLITIDPLTAAYTTVGPTALSALVEGDLAFNPLDGRLYAAWDLQGGARLVEINPVTGIATPIGTLPIGAANDYSALAFDSAGTLYSIDTGWDSFSRLITIDPATATVLTSVVMNLDLGAGAGLAFDPATGVAYVVDGDNAGTNRLYTLDKATGGLTDVGPLGPQFGLSGLTFSTPGIPPAIPEPSTTLFGLALLGACAAARRRAKSR